MATATYINDLLYRYDCVILPGFGAFITQRQSASLDSQSNEFHPPQKSVSFNVQLIKNDGLLANHMAEVENLPYKQAIEKLGLFVEDLQNLLEKNRTVQLNGLGSFTLTDEDNLQFEPVANKNYLKEAFGLASYTSNPIVREDVVNHPVQLDVETSDRSINTHTPTSRPYLKYAAIGLLAIGLSGFTGMNIYSSRIAEHNIAEQQEAAYQLGNQIQQATFIIENPLPSVTLNVTKQSGNYHVVAGAFRMEENAEKKVEDLKKKGFKARQIGANQYGLHQVVYSSYPTRAEALKALRTIKKSSNPSAWLLVQDL